MAEGQTEKESREKEGEDCVSHEMLSVEKLMMVVMKLSRRRTLRIAFQSLAGSPMRRQMDSMAILIILGGLARVLISTRCCLFIDFTAVDEKSLIIEAAILATTAILCLMLNKQ